MIDQFLSALGSVVSWVIEVLLPVRVYALLLLAAIVYLGTQGWPAA